MLQCLQNKNITKARELLLEGTLDGVPAAKCLFSNDEIKELFKKYPPDNIICPICKKDTIEYIFDEYYLKWEETSFCKTCAMMEYKQGLNKDIDEIMIKICSLRYSKANINDFPVTYRDIYKKTNSLFLHGSRGVGKTYLMAAILREIILKTPPAKQNNKLYRKFNKMLLFISVPELLMEIRACYNKKDINEEELISKYSDIDILFLDDLGAEKPTEWALQTLYLIIDRRYRNIKRTIISSNYNLNQISKRLDDRISSRIAGMCKVIKIQGKDRRI